MRTKETFSLEEMLTAEKKKLEKYEIQYKDLQEKIKACKANVQKYQLMYDSERLESLTKSLHAHGIKVEDIISALANGDLTELQDKLDSNYTSATGRITAETDDD